MPVPEAGDTGGVRGETPDTLTHHPVPDTDTPVLQDIIVVPSGNNVDKVKCGRFKMQDAFCEPGEGCRVQCAMCKVQDAMGNATV